MITRKPELEFMLQPVSRRWSSAFRLFRAASEFTA